MFGIIVSGRAVQTNFEPIGTSFLVTIPDADNVNHIVVFMTGQQAFPEGMAGLRCELLQPSVHHARHGQLDMDNWLDAVYFSWPSPDGPPGWALLGAVSNDKPSCVFKVAGLKKGGESAAGAVSFGQQLSHNAQIGIAVEHMAVVQQNMAMLEDQKAGQQTRFVEFCQRMLENFFNYASSFALSQTQMTPNPAEVFVPLSVLQNWYQNFERRFAMNPNFWQS